MGAGKYKLARLRASKLMVLAVFLGLVAMGMTLLLRAPMLTLYNISDTAKTYANQFMTMYAFLALFQAFSLVAIVGVLRGGGDGRFAAFVDVLTIWLIAIPLGFLSGHVWGWPAAVVFTLLKCDEVFKSIITLPRLLGGRWVRDVTK